METAFKNVENDSAKQCSVSDEVIEIQDSPPFARSKKKLTPVATNVQNSSETFADNLYTDSTNHCLFADSDIEFFNSEQISTEPNAEHATSETDPSSKESENNEVTDVSELAYVSRVQEEPIDLTYASSKAVPLSTEKVFLPPGPKPEQIIRCFPANNFPTLKQPHPFPAQGFKRKIDHPMISGDKVMMSNWPQPKAYPIPSPQPPPSHSYSTVQQTSNANQQQEILRMAKSIFSKRTRTLYHWMYPTASKQLVKQIVSETWDCMSAQEKNIYVAQIGKSILWDISMEDIVLDWGVSESSINHNFLHWGIKLTIWYEVMGRFGYTNASLMVNPQLGQIKELPPMPGIEEYSSKATELQNAISSITNETPNHQMSPTSNLSLQNLKKKQKLSKKKLLRSFSNDGPEFDDDPELSQELAQFSVMFKNQL